MDFYRIGEKLVSRDKIIRAVDRMLDLRQQGLSQTDVASRLKIDRTLVSRLEALGEVRTGGPIAIVGFPVANKAEIQAVADEEGVDYTLLFTDEERWAFVQQKDGLSLFNDIMDILIRLRQHRTVIVIGSEFRVKLAQGLIDGQVISVPLGRSPITGDRTVDIDLLRSVIRRIKGTEGDAT